MNAGNFRNISQIEQIQEEINVLSNLKHPNIIHLLESTFIGKMVYVIMEYVAGGSLMDHLNVQVCKPAITPSLLAGCSQCSKP